MSTAELKEAANKLSPGEQNFLHAYLGLKRRLQDPAFLTELSRRDGAMEAGDYLTSEQIRDLPHPCSSVPSAVKNSEVMT